jgi:hypothetical protein
MTQGARTSATTAVALRTAGIRKDIGHPASLVSGPNIAGR